MTDVTNKVAQLSEKAYDFLLDRMYFTDDNGYEKLLVFTRMLNSLILHSNKNIANLILARISSEKIKLFDTNLERSMSSLANGRVILKFNNSDLVYRNFVLNLHIL